MATAEGEVSLQGEGIMFPDDNFGEILQVLEEDEELETFIDDITENVSTNLYTKPE